MSQEHHAGPEETLGRAHRLRAVPRPGARAIRKRRAPFAEREIGADRNGGSFFTFGDDLEEQLGAFRVDLHVAQFVEAKLVKAAVDARRARWPGVMAGRHRC